MNKILFLKKVYQNRKFPLSLLFISPKGIVGAIHLRLHKDIFNAYKKYIKNYYILENTFLIFI